MSLSIQRRVHLQQLASGAVARCESCTDQRAPHDLGMVLTGPPFNGLMVKESAPKSEILPNPNPSLGQGYHTTRSSSIKLKPTEKYVFVDSMTETGVLSKCDSSAENNGLTESAADRFIFLAQTFIVVEPHINIYINIYIHDYELLESDRSEKMNDSQDH